MNLFKEIYRDLVNEGITFQKNGNFINGKINSLTTDYDNKDFDTRIFGKKEEILNGDDTYKKNGINIRYNTKNSLVKTYKSIIDYIKNGRKGEIYTDEFTPAKTLNTIQNIDTMSDEEVVRKATRNIEKQGAIGGIYSGTYQRLQSLNNEEKTERYLKGVVPGTNVTLISLFKFNDFNVSDFLKNGNFRQNDTTDKILGIDSSERETIPKLYGRGAPQQKKIQATYDNGLKPNINGNFSLKDTNPIDYETIKSDDHFGRTSYDYRDTNYHSITQFIDKSILYAAYVMKKEKITPNYIVAAPSSSKFNHNYCIRLSNKTGIEYVPDFFMKNVINVVFDREGLIANGVTEEKTNEIENQIRSTVYAEISNKIGQHIIQFFNKNNKYFVNVVSKKYDRKKTDIRIIESFVLNYAYEYLEQIIQNLKYVDDTLSLTILNNLNFAKKSSKIDNVYLGKQITNIIRKYLLKEFTLALNKMTVTMLMYRQKLINGYKPNFEAKSFKITDVPDMARQFLKDCYVIADKELSSKQGYQLLSRYKNSKFLVFDEDIQSGGTLKLLIQCMIDKNIETKNITCLVQAYGE